MFKIVELEQGSSEWHEFRKDKIGGSMAPSILGVGFETPYKLWKRLIDGTEIPDNPGMKRGRELEPMVRAYVEDLTNQKYAPAVVQSLEHPWMIASLDGYNADTNWFLEIKCPNEHCHELARQGQIPPQYVPQMGHAAIITGARTGIYASYRNDEVLTVLYKHEEYDCETHIAKIKEFYDCLTSLVPPDLTDKDWVTSTDETFLAIEKDYLEAKKQYDNASQELEYWKQRLIAASQGRNTIGRSLTVGHFSRKGNVQYKDIPELKSVDVEKYRGKPTMYSQIREKKDVVE